MPSGEASIAPFLAEAAVCTCTERPRLPQREEAEMPVVWLGVDFMRGLQLPGCASVVDVEAVARGTSTHRARRTNGTSRCSSARAPGHWGAHDIANAMLLLRS